MVVSSNYSKSFTLGLHEDLERLERIIVKDYKQEAKGHKEKLQQNHRVRKRMDEMQQIARKLVSAWLKYDVV
jgi:splicing factor 3A subunit 3